MPLLSEVCNLNMGQSPDSTSYNEAGDGLPFFQGNADFGAKNPTVRIWCTSPTKIAHEGDILISVRAPIGALNIADCKCCIGRGLAALTVDKAACTREYLWYAIQSKVDELNAKGTGSTFKAISKAVLAETEIPLPELSEQTRISNVLTQLDTMITLRKQQLAKLDELVKARFVELFGGVQQRRRLETFSELITKGASPKWQGVDYCDEGVLFVTSENVRAGYLDFTKQKFLPYKINEIQPRSVLKKNDILINIVNASIGRAAIYDKDVIANINQAVALVRINPQKINLTFLLTYLNSDYALMEYDFMKVGGDKSNLSLKNIADLSIPDAPIELQNQFATFVEQTDKSKLTVQQSLDKLELLKKSLMQQYFG